MDIWDKRVVTADVVFDKIKTFFEINGLISDIGLPHADARPIKGECL
jgi:hypothetical protein